MRPLAANWSSDQFAYTESIKHRLISATEFKANCLALLDEVDDQGGSITVTKRGRPVATVVPVKKQPWKSPKGILQGKVKIVGDIVNLDTADLWNVVHAGGDPDKI